MARGINNTTMRGATGEVDTTAFSRVAETRRTFSDRSQGAGSTSPLAPTPHAPRTPPNRNSHRVAPTRPLPQIPGESRQDQRQPTQGNRPSLKTPTPPALSTNRSINSDYDNDEESVYNAQTQSRTPHRNNIENTSVVLSATSLDLAPKTTKRTQETLATLQTQQTYIAQLEAQKREAKANPIPKKFEYLSEFFPEQGVRALIETHKALCAPNDEIKSGHLYNLWKDNFSMEVGKYQRTKQTSNKNALSTDFDFIEDIVNNKLSMRDLLGALCFLELIHNGETTRNQAGSIITNKESRLQKYLYGDKSHSTKDSVKKLLQAGADPNFHDQDGNTLLYEAMCSPGNDELIDTILDAGASIDFGYKQWHRTQSRSVPLEGNPHAQVPLLFSITKDARYAELLLKRISTFQDTDRIWKHQNMLNEAIDLAFYISGSEAEQSKGKLDRLISALKKNGAKPTRFWLEEKIYFSSDKPSASKGNTNGELELSAEQAIFTDILPLLQNPPLKGNTPQKNIVLDYKKSNDGRGNETIRFAWKDGEPFFNSAKQRRARSGVEAAQEIAALFTKEFGVEIKANIFSLEKTAPYDINNMINKMIDTLEVVIDPSKDTIYRMTPLLRLVQGQKTEPRRLVCKRVSDNEVRFKAELIGKDCPEGWSPETAKEVIYKLSQQQ